MYYYLLCTGLENINNCGDCKCGAKIVEFHMCTSLNIVNEYV